MNETILISTSPKAGSILESLLENKIIREKLVHNLQVSFPSDATSNQDQGEIKDRADQYYLEANPSLLIIKPSFPAEAKPFISNLSRRLRSLISQGSSFAHLIILGTLHEHDSNLLTIFSLAAALEVKKLLAQSPVVRIDLVGLLPSIGHTEEQQLICLSFLEEIGRLHESAKAKEPGPAYKSLIIAEDEPDASSPNPFLLNSISTLIEFVREIDKQQLIASSAPADHHLGIFGYNDIAYRIGDYLRLLPLSGGPDIGNRLLLKPYEKIEVPSLCGIWADWRKGIMDDAFENFEHMKSNFEMNAGSIPLPVEGGDFERNFIEFLNKLDLLQIQIRFDPSVIEQESLEFKRRLEKRWDNLIDKCRLSLACAELFGRALCEAPVDPIAEIDIVSDCWTEILREYVLETIGHFNDLIDVEAIRENLEKGDFHTARKRLAQCDDQAVRILNDLIDHALESKGRNGDLVQFMESELRDFFGKLRSIFKAFLADLEEIEKAIQSLKTSGPPKLELLRFWRFCSGWRARKAYWKNLNELSEKKHQKTEEGKRRLLLLATIPRKVTDVFPIRPQNLGAWGMIRKRMEEVSSQVASATENIKKEFQNLCAQTSDGLGKVKHDWSLAGRLLETEKYNPERMESVFQEAEKSFKNDDQPFATGSFLRTHAEKISPNIRSLMPPEIVAELPWNVTEALVKPGKQTRVEFLSGILKVLTLEAGKFSKLTGFELSREWKPPIFPFLAVEEKDRDILVDLATHKKMPQVFSSLSSYEWSFIFHEAPPDILELRFFCLCLSPRWLNRYESMKEMAQKAESFAHEKGEKLIEYGEIYQLLVEET